MRFCITDPATSEVNREELRKMSKTTPPGVSINMVRAFALNDEPMFDGVRYYGRWRDYYVYAPYSKNPICIGLPMFILVSEDRSICWNDPDDAFKIMDECQRH